MEPSDVKVNGAEVVRVTLGGAVLFNRERYELLEWIEGDGASWINTGVPFDQTHTISVRGERNGSSSDNYLFGVRDGIDANRIACDIWSASYYPMYGSYFSNAGALSNNKIAVDLKGGVWKLGSKTLTLDKLTGKGALPYYIFAYCASSGAARSICKGIRLSLADFATEDGDVLGQFRPARRLSDGAVGMVNLVTRRFHANQGTGQFIPGPTKNEII